MTLRYYTSQAQDTTTTGAITSGATTMAVSSVTGWPTSYPFTLAVDYSTSLEELVDVTNVSGLTVTITRGVDGSTPAAHGVGATVRHVISARDARESNSHVNATSSAHAITAISGLGSGVATFLATPTSSNLASTVSDETGSGSLVFGTGPIVNTAVATPTFSSNVYTLVLTDASKVLLASNGSTAGTVTIPTNASVAFPVGTTITVIQTGSGQLTVQGASGVTLASIGATSTAPKLRIQNSPVTLVQTSANTWYAIGDIV